MRRFYRPRAQVRLIIRNMNRDTDRTEAVARVLSLALPETQWRAFLAVEPEPIEWLRHQIRDRLESAGVRDEAESPHGRQVLCAGGSS